VLFRLRKVVEGQVRLADVLVDAEVARIERQRLLVERDGLCRLAALPRGVGELIPRVGVVRGALNSRLQQRDRPREVLGLDRLRRRAMRCVAGVPSCSYSTRNTQSGVSPFTLV
jgi:hypothetical protein